MTFREIVSVTGLPGLYQMQSSKSNGAVVKSLENGQSKFISARLHQVTPLESIEIFTTGDNVYLYEVLDKMQEADATARPDTKDAPDAIKAYFREIFPDLDEDRVYVSDMKKMLRWYDLLKQNNLLDFSARKQQAGDEEVVAGEDTGHGNADAGHGGEAIPDTSVEEASQLEENAKPSELTSEPLVETGGDADAAATEAKPKKAARRKAAETTDAPANGDAPKKKAAAKKKTDEQAN